MSSARAPRKTPGIVRKRERLLQRYDRYQGVHPLRLDHFNALVPDVQGTTDFFAALGFRLTE